MRIRDHGGSSTRTRNWPYSRVTSWRNALHPPTDSRPTRKPMAGCDFRRRAMQRGTKIVIAVILIASVFAGVTLYAESTLRQAFQRQLLVVMATDNVTSDAPSGTMIPADFGPHCAKAQFAQSGALIVESDVIPADASGGVYLKHDPDGSFKPLNGTGDR